MIYLDTSVVVSVFLPDVHAGRALTWLGEVGEPPTLSHWTVTEFSSAAARQLRMGQIAPETRLAVERSFDAWLLAVEHAAVVRADFELARDLLRGGPTRLRAADALHLAIARRLDARLATLDTVMADAAREAGVALEPV